MRLKSTKTWAQLYSSSPISISSLAASLGKSFSAQLVLGLDLARLAWKVVQSIEARGLSPDFHAEWNE